MAKRPAPVAEPEEPQDTEESNGMSKMEMVLEALEHGCPTAKTGIPYLDKKYPGHGIAADYYGVCKSNHKKRQGGGTATLERSTPAAPAVRDLPTSFGKDMMKIKELLETAGGAEELKDLFNTVGDLQQRYGLKNIDQMIDALS